MKEKTIYRICLPMMAAAAIFTVTVAIHDRSAKSAVYAAPVELVDNFTAETEKAPEKADFDAQSAMPCVDGERFEEWYETYTLDAVATQPVAADDNTENETEEPEAEVAEGAPIYRIDGTVIDPKIQQTLWEHLNAAGIGYWYTGALAQMMQESGGDPMIVNPTNGIDMGLYQYREPFWDYSRGDIFDPEAQIALYVEETAARINAGLTVDEVISRHNTSDFVTEVNWQYVQEVKRHLPTMEAIR